MSETQANPQLTGKMFLFEKPELMNSDQHGDLGITVPAQRYGFCANATIIPVTISEVPAIAKHYPVIYISQDQLVPLAVVGVIDNVNLFVDEKGEWEANCYIPGYVRRYPFGLAGEASGDRMAVVIDTAFEGLKPGGDAPLFENGQPTDMTRSAIEFCKTFENDRHTTEDFGKRIKEYDLIQPQGAQYTLKSTGEAQTFATYFSIDENKFKALSDEQFLELKNSNMLPIIYAMTMSLSNWRSILQRRARRFGLTEDQMLLPAVN